MRFARGMGALACGLLMSISMQAYAAEPAEPAKPATADRQETVAADNDKILAARTFRTSKLIGMNVRNMQGEELGTINDLVIDVKTGKVAYAAMSVGGVLGIGDSLHAVPFSELKFDHGQDEMFFVLDMKKEKIAASPGFNQNDWPDFADPNWTDKIEKHYRKVETRTGAQQNTDPREDRVE